MDVRIKTPGYENIYLDCPFCNHENVFNRVTDLGCSDSIDRLDNIFCEKCKEPFDIISDRAISAKYKWFLEELKILKKMKMYRTYILNLCQGLEMFFYQAIINEKFDRNRDFRSEGRIVLEEYNKKRKAYEKEIRKWAFDKMREEFLNVFKKEQENFLPKGIKLKQDKRNECFRLIKSTDIGGLRNKVAHKYAHRPSLVEIEKYDYLIDAVNWLGLYLDVKNSIIHINKRVGTNAIR